MTYGLKLSLKARMLKFYIEKFIILKFNELLIGAATKGRTTSWIAELPNFEHVPHFIAELSANCSQTYILLQLSRCYEIFNWILNIRLSYFSKKNNNHLLLYPYPKYLFFTYSLNKKTNFPQNLVKKCSKIATKLFEKKVRSFTILCRNKPNSIFVGTVCRQFWGTDMSSDP